MTISRSPSTHLIYVHDLVVENIAMSTWRARDENLYFFLSQNSKLVMVQPYGFSKWNEGLLGGYVGVTVLALNQVKHRISFICCCTFKDH